MEMEVIGIGYAGPINGIRLADWGHEAYCVDIEESKVGLLLWTRTPIYETGPESW